jgi:hypothetical protein
MNRHKSAATLSALVLVCCGALILGQNVNAAGEGKITGTVKLDGAAPHMKGIDVAITTAHGASVQQRASRGSVGRPPMFAYTICRPHFRFPFAIANGNLPPRGQTPDRSDQPLWQIWARSPRLCGPLLTVRSAG